MKKIILFFSALAFLGACRKADDGFDDNGQISRIAYTVEATYGDAFNNLKAAGAVVKLTDSGTGQAYEATTNDEGKATFSLFPGTYNIEVTKSLTQAQSNTLFGFDNEANFSASRSGVNISAQTAALTLKMVTGRMGDLVFKQIYYTGSDLQKGANFYDQYFEVYNNSTDTIYLDGIYFAQATGVQSVSPANKGKTGYLESGQYDWSQAQDLEGLGDKANTDYVYARTVIAFPGSGKEYPLAPGKSKIVASTARNHQQPLPKKPNQKATQGVINPELTVDLSNAHFEVYLDPVIVPTTQDSDNPNVPNMEFLYKSGGRDFILDPIGRDAFFLFRDTKENFNAYKRVPLPTVTTNAADATKHIQIPVDKVIDGVNANHHNAQMGIPHRLPNSIDSGELRAEGQYTSEVFIRKVKETKNGLTIYQDTNNSTNDFERKKQGFDLSSLNQ